MKNEIEKKVKEIIERVKKEGDRALIYYTEKFDHLKLKKSDLLVNQKEIKEAYKKVDAEFLEAIKRTCDHLYCFQRRKEIIASQKVISSLMGIKRKEKYAYLRGDVREEIVPLERVGIYVPGGRYSYPSTVLMAALPAKAAGVREILLATPGKNLSPEVLVAADLCGVKKIYRIGGAQAIAAFAYGTETVPKVDKIVGPGNIYVTLAKKIIFGEVGIDMLAGPSEIVILADSSANEDFIFFDLLAQIEHDARAQAVLLSKETDLLERIRKRVPAKFKKQVTLLKIKNLEEGVNYVNRQAPEHLELMVKNPQELLTKIKNAGAIFLGNYSPVAIGDYFAGPSHILPTGGTAKFSSGLSIYDFLKRRSVIGYSKENLRRDLSPALTLAKTEGMKYHYQSLKIRKES